MNLLISIIIPTFNREVLLARAISSVLDQSYTNFELIIVDDGSTDETTSRVRGIFDPRIRYYRKENEERSIARNTGINLAKGEYICFLDADDYYYPNHLKDAITFIHENNFPEIFCFGYDCVDSTGLKMSTWTFGERTLNDLIIEENKVSLNAVVVKTEVIKRFPFIHDRAAVIGEDWYVWIRLASRYDFFHVPIITSAVVQHGDRSIDTIEASTLELSYLIMLKKMEQDSQIRSRFGLRYNKLKSSLFSMIALRLSEQHENVKSMYYFGKAQMAFPFYFLSKKSLVVIRNLIFRR